MEWKFAKMARNVSRDRSCLAEFFNDSMIFKDFTDALVRRDRFFCALVLPEAYRQILRARLFGSGMIDKDDIWLKFTAQLVSLNDLTDESTDAEKDVVIDLAVKTFCERHQMISLSRDAEGGDDE